MVDRRDSASAGEIEGVATPYAHTYMYVLRLYVHGTQRNLNGPRTYIALA